MVTALVICRPISIYSSLTACAFYIVFIARSMPWLSPSSFFRAKHITRILMTGSPLSVALNLACNGTIKVTVGGIFASRKLNDRTTVWKLFIMTMLKQHTLTCDVQAV